MPIDVNGTQINWCGVTASDLGWSEGVTQTVKIVRHEASAPTDLTPSVEPSTSVRLRWTAPAKNGGSPITGYRIEYSEDGGGNWDDLVADTGSTDLTYLDTDVGPGITRSYRVSAITRFGPGVASERCKSATIDSGSGLSGLALSDGTSPLGLAPEIRGGDDRLHGDGGQRGVAGHGDGDKERRRRDARLPRRQ